MGKRLGGQLSALSFQLSVKANDRVKANDQRPTARRPDSRPPPSDIPSEIAHQFGRAHGLERCTDRAGGGVRAYRQARSRAYAIRERCGAAAHASQVPALALPGKDFEDSSG